MRAPLVPISLALLLGLLAAAWCPLPLWVVLGCGAISGLLAWSRHAPQRWRLFALLLVWVCVGILRMELWAAHPDARLIEVLSEEPQPVRLHGIVRDDPSELFRADESLSQSCVIQLLDANPGSGWRSLNGRVRVTVSSPREPLAYGDEVVLEGAWSRVPSPGNPGQYDWRESLARQHVHGVVRVQPFDGVVIRRRDQWPVGSAAVHRLRQRWQALLERAFAPRDAGLLRSLLLGQRVALDERLKAAFVETGTIHLLVISGFNVALVAGLLDLILRLLGIPWGFRWPLIAVSLGAYSILTGLQPPVIRAMVMAWVILGALVLDRAASWPNIVAAAALAILWVNPTQVFDPSCQLSFGAVISLLVFTPRWSPWLEERLAWMPVARLRRYLAAGLSTTAAVWVGLAPLLAWYFHLVTPVSLLANLVLAPLMSGLIAVGTALLAVGSAWPAVLTWNGWLVAGLLRVTLWCVSWCHAIPGGAWHVGHPSPALLIGYYGLVAVSLVRGRLRWTSGRVLLCWAAAATVWLWSLVAVRIAESRWLRVDVLDVGHGDSIVLRTPQGRTLVVDAGTMDAGRLQVVPALRYRGISIVDALVLTHGDADHAGGAAPLLEQLQVRRLLTNGVPRDTMSARAMRRLVVARQVPEAVVAAGMRLVGEPALTIDVLHPPRGLVPGVAPASNDNSIVLRVTDGAVSFLLCGDLEEAGIPWLLRRHPDLRTTVLKVPHHGSRLGEAGERFFDAVAPRLAVISIGHERHLPAPETVRSLASRGAALYSTRRDGAVQLRTDGRCLQIRTVRSRSEHWVNVE